MKEKGRKGREGGITPPPLLKTLVPTLPTSKPMVIFGDAQCTCINPRSHAQLFKGGRGGKNCIIGGDIS